jgi:hypothetical protein
LIRYLDIPSAIRNTPPRVLGRLNLLTSRPILADMAKKPTTPPLLSFNVYKTARKAVWLVTVEATDERDAIERVASERNLPANRLIAVQRR